MTANRRQLLTGAGAAAAALTLPRGALAADDYPNKPIKIIVAAASGGPTDVPARLASEIIKTRLGQAAVVENRPGAGGAIGARAGAAAPPDGYTLFMGNTSTFAVIPAVSRSAGYDPVKDFVPIIRITEGFQILVVHPSSPWKTVKEFVDYTKANPGKINYGHQGKANTGHLLGELMMLKAGIKMTAVPYRGSAPAIKDLLAGTIDMVPDYLLANKGNIDAGKLKFIAVASQERLKEYSKVPTVAETLPGVVSITWMAVSAPPKTPAAITKRISDEIGKGFKEADMQEKIRKLLADPLGSTPEQMRDMIKQSLDTWEPVIKAAKISID